MTRSAGPVSAFERLPPLVVAIALVVVGIEAVFQLGARGIVGGPEAVGWRVDAMARFGFSAPLFRRELVVGASNPGDLARLALHPLIHQGLTHAIFGVVLLLALGKAVSERFSGPAVAGVIAAGALGGAVAYGLVVNGRGLLVGVYPAVYGLIGAYTWALWRAGRGRERLAAFRLIAVLTGLRAALLLTVGGGMDWVADLGGFAAGFAASFLLAPDGGERLRRLRDKARNRSS